VERHYVFPAIAEVDGVVCASPGHSSLYNPFKLTLLLRGIDERLFHLAIG